MTTNGPEKGDKVSWNWGGGAPGGTVAETKDQGEIAIKSKRGNTIKKNASPDNPAVRIKRSGNDVVKRASELNVEAKASEHKNKDDNGSKSGGKRKAESQECAKADADEADDDPKRASDPEDVHTINKQGKEVRKGGKDANKRQKIFRDGDVKGENEGEAEAKETEEEEKGTEEVGEGNQEADTDENIKRTNTNKQSSTKKARVGEVKDEDESSVEPPQDENQVSARTRSHDKAT
ncbi:hypothetical protein GGR58DRAFT_93115 [Xylaria digitata]|nr:hypothetical protein GGR58DRAFT_93115 [Xylaria digitata]